MRFHHKTGVFLVVAVAMAGGANCLAQEVGFVDLTRDTARTELRRPGSTPGTRQRGGILADHLCSNAAQTTDALRTTLVSLDRAQYRVGDEPTYEITVENVGSASLRIPFSPHLADLQPEDPAEKFAYSELRLLLWIAADKEWSANTGGGSLYGDEDHADTMLTLNSGEWVRIIGKGKFVLPADGSVVERIHWGYAVDQAYAQVSLYGLETLLTPTATATISRETCLRQTHGESIPIALIGLEQ